MRDHDVVVRPRTCFFEEDSTRSIAGQAFVEALDTMLLVLAIAGDGLTSQALLRGSSLLASMVGAVVTGGAPTALIVAFGSASGGHFNPLISVLQSLTGERPWQCALWYVVAQVCGGLIGALLANVIFEADRSTPTTHAAPWRLAVSELISTAALFTIVFGCARSGRRDTGPFAVGVWIAVASLATPSASLANPAITLAALVTDGPLALRPTVVLLYLIAECAGALLAVPLIAVSYPRVPISPIPQRPAASAHRHRSVARCAQYGFLALGTSRLSRKAGRVRTRADGLWPWSASCGRRQPHRSPPVADAGNNTWLMTYRSAPIRSCRYRIACLWRLSASSFSAVRLTAHGKKSRLVIR